MERGDVVVGRVDEMDATRTIFLDVGRDRVVVRKTGAEWEAHSMRCPHKGGQMRDKDLRGCILACPLHGWMFDLSDHGRETHGYADLPEYNLYVEDGIMKISFV